MIGFETGERRLTTRLLAGEFIRYRSRFPEEFGCTAELPADAFTEAVRRVALVAERGTPVRLSFGPGRVTIVAGTQGQARARESVSADFSGDEPAIAFSPQYLLDGIVAAASGSGGSGSAGSGTAGTGTDGADDSIAGTRVRLQFTSASKAAVISRSATAEPGEDSAFRYLVVPQRTVQ
jgi:DNA polymerase-3 subunit beta